MKKSLLFVIFLTLSLLLLSCAGSNGEASSESEAAETDPDACVIETPSENENGEAEDIASLLPEYADSIRYYEAADGYDLVVVGKNGKLGVMDYNGNLVTAMRFYSMNIEPTEPNGDETKIFGYCGCVTEFWIETDGRETEKGPGESGRATGADVYWMDGAPVMFDWDEGLVEFSYEKLKSYRCAKNVLGMYTNRVADVIPVNGISSYSENVSPDGEKTYSVVISEPKFALLDTRTGKLVTDFVFDGYGGLGFSEGVLPVRKDGKWGYVDESGRMLTDFIYDESLPPVYSSDEEPDPEGMMYSALNGYVVVRKGDKWGLIDFQGNTVFDVKYDGFSQADPKGRIWVMSDGKWTLVTLDA